MAMPNKPILADGKYTVVPAEATLADVVPSGATSVITDSGHSIPAAEFARTPVPDGFDSCMSALNKGRI